MQALTPSVAHAAAGWCICAALAAWTTPAHAHLMPAGHGTVNVVGDKA